VERITLERCNNELAAVAVFAHMDVAITAITSGSKEIKSIETLEFGTQVLCEPRSMEFCGCQWKSPPPTTETPRLPQRTVTVKGALCGAAIDGNVAVCGAGGVTNPVAQVIIITGGKSCCDGVSQSFKKRETLLQRW
jgi:hypothetical protein